MLRSIVPLVCSSSAALAATLLASTSYAAETEQGIAPEAAPTVNQTAVGPLNVREYRVAGAKHLTPAEIGEAVYPFLGPGRTLEHIEGALVGVSGFGFLRLGFA